MVKLGQYPGHLANDTPLLIRDRLNQYVIELRKNDFEVEIYEEKIAKYSQAEIDWYQEAQKTKQLSPDEVKEKIDVLRK